ncbi:uncharacterized, partial [Tachysurus ichikawai]
FIWSPAVGLRMFLLAPLHKHKELERKSHQASYHQTV